MIVICGFTPSALGTTEPAGPALQSFVLETILTAMLMFVVLAVSAIVAYVAIKIRADQKRRRPTRTGEKIK